MSVRGRERERESEREQERKEREREREREKGGGDGGVRTGNVAANAKNYAAAPSGAPEDAGRQ